jgi:hypothetical protein
MWTRTIFSASGNPVKLADLRHPCFISAVSTSSGAPRARVTNTLILRLFPAWRQCVSSPLMRQGRPQAFHQIISLGACNSSSQTAIRQIS